MPIDSSPPDGPTSSPPARTDTWRLGPGDSALLTPKGASISLTPGEGAVLRRLMATRGHQVPRDTLIATLTNDTSAFHPHRLEMLIHRLRVKVVDHSGERLPVRAVRGEGYVLLS